MPFIGAVNMVQEWKEDGILIIRQVSSSNPMEIRQSLYHVDPDTARFTELEEYPYNVFPIGANSVSWIDN